MDAPEKQNTLSNRSFIYWGLACAWMLLIFLVSSLPDTGASWFLDNVPQGDKLVHAVSFGLLAFLLFKASKNTALAFTFTALYGFSDEMHQYFVPGRQLDVFDWLADMLGAALVLLLMQRFRKDKTEEKVEP